VAAPIGGPPRKLPQTNRLAQNKPDVETMLMKKIYPRIFSSSYQTFTWITEWCSIYIFLNRW
jgi:hypothetical protein